MEKLKLLELEVIALRTAVQILIESHPKAAEIHALFEKMRVSTLEQATSVAERDAIDSIFDFRLLPLN